jgi:hypothetical protein
MRCSDSPFSRASMACKLRRLHRALGRPGPVLRRSILGIHCFSRRIRRARRRYQAGSATDSPKARTQWDLTAPHVNQDMRLPAHPFGTNSFGFSDPSPKKNFSISFTRNARAFGSMGVSRFSLMSMV